MMQRSDHPHHLTQALVYGRDGWRVLPVREKGKAPSCKHGVNDATCDTNRIRRWWNRHPRANIGIAVPRGYVVLDLDSEDALQAIRHQKLSLPATPWAKTGRGMHLWYATGDAPVKNKVGLFEGIDVRASGGYVVAPPSVHPSGAIYRWEEEFQRSAIARCPDWLLEEVRGKRSSAGAKITPPGRTPEDWERTISAPVAEGRRNQTLAEVSGLLFRRLPAATAAEMAYCWAKQKLRPPLPEDEIRRTIDSIAGCEFRRRGGQT